LEIWGYLETEFFFSLTLCFPRYFLTQFYAVLCLKQASSVIVSVCHITKIVKAAIVQMADAANIESHKYSSTPTSARKIWPKRFKISVFLLQNRRYSNGFLEIF